MKAAEGQWVRAGKREGRRVIKLAKITPKQIENLNQPHASSTCPLCCRYFILAKSFYSLILIHLSSRLYSWGFYSCSLFEVNCYAWQFQHVSAYWQLFRLVAGIKSIHLICFAVLRTQCPHCIIRVIRWKYTDVLSCSIFRPFSEFSLKLM